MYTKEQIHKGAGFIASMLSGEQREAALKGLQLASGWTEKEFKEAVNALG